MKKVFMAALAVCAMFATTSCNNDDDFGGEESVIAGKPTPTSTPTERYMSVRQSLAFLQF